MPVRDDTELIIDGLFSEGIIAYQRCLGHAVGDVVAALLLSQFWYWSKRQPEERKGWFYMTRNQIFEETAMTRREQETARKRLKTLGVLNEERKGVPARVWYRIDRQAVINLLRQHAKPQLVQIVPTRKTGTSQLESAERANKPVGNRPTISKTSLKTSQTTSAAEDDAAGLLDELVSHGLNRIDAIRLAAIDRDECRRQLEFLSFRIRGGFVFKSGKGAFLRRAIEDGFAPPAGYADAVRVEALQSKRLAHQKAQVTQGETKRRWLRETLARLKVERPDAFTDFMAYFELKKQAAISKPILDKAPEVKARLLREFEAEGNRIALLEEYLLLNGDGAPNLEPQDDLYDPFEDD